MENNRLCDQPRYNPLNPSKIAKGKIADTLESVCAKGLANVCSSFKRNQEINPLTNKRIAVGKEMHNFFSTLCVLDSAIIKRQTKSPSIIQDQQRHLLMKEDLIARLAKDIKKEVSFEVMNELKAEIIGNLGGVIKATIEKDMMQYSKTMINTIVDTKIAEFKTTISEHESALKQYHKKTIDQLNEDSRGVINRAIDNKVEKILKRDLQELWKSTLSNEIRDTLMKYTDTRLHEIVDNRLKKIELANQIKNEEAVTLIDVRVCFMGFKSKDKKPKVDDDDVEEKVKSLKNKIENDGGVILNEDDVDKTDIEEDVDIIIIPNNQHPPKKLSGLSIPVLNLIDFDYKYFPLLPLNKKSSNDKFSGKFIAFQQGYSDILAHRYVVANRGAIVEPTFSNIHIFITDPDSPDISHSNLKTDTEVLTVKEFWKKYMFNCKDKHHLENVFNPRTDSTIENISFAVFDQDMLDYKTIRFFIKVCGAKYTGNPKDAKYIIYVNSKLESQYKKEHGLKMLHIDEFIEDFLIK